MSKNDIIKNDKKFELNRPITGVIQEDRIWEQWYNPEKMKESLPKMNQADYEELCNKDYPNDYIINNRGLKRITNKEFIEMRNNIIKSLKAMGSGKGDIVVSISLSTQNSSLVGLVCELYFNISFIFFKFESFIMYISLSETLKIFGR